MERNAETLTLYPKKSKILGMLVLSSVFVAASVWMIETGEHFGWVGLIFFGLALLASLFMLVTNTSYLRLTKEGFETRSIFKTSFTDWKDVETFGVGSIERNKMVVFNYSASHQKNAKIKQLSRDFAGFEGSVSNMYGDSPEEMAQLMNDWKLTAALTAAANSIHHP
jgi:hypothetical protein